MCRPAPPESQQPASRAGHDSPRNTKSRACAQCSVDSRASSRDTASVQRRERRAAAEARQEPSARLPRLSCAETSHREPTPPDPRQASRTRPLEGPSRVRSLLVLLTFNRASFLSALLAGRASFFSRAFRRGADQGQPLGAQGQPKAVSKCFAYPRPFILGYARRLPPPPAPGRARVRLCACGLDFGPSCAWLHLWSHRVAVRRLRLQNHTRRMHPSR